MAGCRGGGRLGEAEVEIAGVRRTVNLFLMRACYSRAFVIAFERQTQQAFLEAHLEAFHFFGGSFQLIRYDTCAQRTATSKFYDERDNLRER